MASSLADRKRVEISEEDARTLIHRRSCERRAPTGAFIRERIRNRAERVRSGRGIRDLTMAELWAEWLPIAGGASYVTVTLDTTGPASPSVSINGGAVYATSQVVTLTIGTADGDTTGYQMKVYGDVDTSYDASVQGSKAASTWISYATSKDIKLSSGDGAKTIYLTIRDDVYNESSEASDSITLDTSLPVVTVQAGSPDVSKISKVTGKDTVTIVWQSSQQYDAYKVKVVPATDSIHSVGTQIPDTAGSTNVQGSTANQPADTNVTTTVKGADLETASSGDGSKIIKIFVQDDAGNWSI